MDRSQPITTTLDRSARAAPAQQAAAELLHDASQRNSSQARTNRANAGEAASTRYVASVKKESIAVPTLQPFPQALLSQDSPRKDDVLKRNPRFPATKRVESQQLGGRDDTPATARPRMPRASDFFMCLEDGVEENGIAGTGARGGAEASGGAKRKLGCASEQPKAAPAYKGGMQMGSTQDREKRQGSLGNGRTSLVRRSSDKNLHQR